MPAKLSADTKDALARDLPQSRSARATLLEALARYGTDRTRTRFVTHRNAVARLFFSLLDKRKAHAVVTAAGTRLRRSSSFAIALPARLRVATAAPSKGSQCKLEVRAAFLVCGSLAAGRGYHLEFVLGDRPRADRLALVLRRFGRAPKRTVRKRRHVLYYKDFDAIADVLGSIGAYAAVLHLSDVRALRETKNRIHRLVNTETANVERAAAAGAAHQRTIRYLESAFGLANLSVPLRETAELRLAHPDETLAELGARCNPPVGKPTLASRLAALASLARRLQRGRARREQRGRSSAKRIG